MLVGILKSYTRPTMIDRMAAMNVKELNGSAFFFNIQDVNFRNKTIKCKRLINGRWRVGVSEFPDVVYNSLPQTRDIPYKLYRKLESFGIPFTTHRLGVSKTEYSSKFDRDSVIQKHLIATHQVQTAEDVLMKCHQYNKIALKPNFGHRGIGVKFIHREINDRFTVFHHNNKVESYNQSEVLGYIDSLLDEKTHHVQRKIDSTVENGNLPLTIRSYMGRGLNGKWFNIFNMVGIDFLGSGVVNPSQGAARLPLDTYLKVIYSSEEASKLKKDLKLLNNQLIKEYQRNFDFLIDALGIDYAIDQNNNIHIIEINGFPGMRPETGSAVYNMIRFTEYLYQQK